MSKNNIKNQLKSISSDFREEANKIRSIANMIDEGWNGQHAVKYLMRLEDFIQKTNNISTDIDTVIYEMHKEIQANEHKNVDAADLE